MRFAVAFIILIFILRCGAATTWNTNTVMQSGGDYASLALWEDARDGNLVGSDVMEVCKIDGSWTAEDTSAVDFDGSTTDSSHYMLVYTTSTARHLGAFSTNAYFLSVANTALDLSDGYVVLDGLQIQETSTGSRNAILISAGGNYITVKNCLLRTDAAGTTSSCITGNAGPFQGVIYNCVMVNQASGGFGYQDSSATGNSNAILNCTFMHSGSAGANLGLRILPTTATYTNLILNCLFSGWQSNNAPILHSASDYNSTTAASMYVSGDSGSAHDRLNQTFTFVAVENYHLSGVDAGGRTYGTNLSGTFTTDFDGETRIVPWDIGADQTNSTASSRFSPFLRGFRR